MATGSNDDTVLYVTVSHSMMIPGPEGEYLAYGIRSIVSKISSDSDFSKSTFLTRRPFVEFENLREFLVTRHSNIELPTLPFPAPPGNEFSPNTNAEMEEKLKIFLNELIAIPEIKKDPCLSLFVQSHRPFEDIRGEVARQNEEANNANDNQQAPANVEQAAANVEQAPENRNGAQGHEGENDAAEYDSDEPIFRMDDID